jgi:hypothetical protein
MAARVHLVKLCVGAESVADLRDWQWRRSEAGQIPLAHVTRMWPKRTAEILEGGSLYWVIKGAVLVRQAISGFEERRGEDGIARCAILLGPDLVRTVPQPRRPFQGWRYLRPDEAPADLDTQQSGDLPPELAAGLAAVGVL